MPTNHVAPFTTVMRDANGGRVTSLLWGDPLHILETAGNKMRVRARAREGWIPTDAVGSTSLLELYVIDVGQGDGVLIKTPDEKWHLIDAGVASKKQMTKKGTANFLRWKFYDDLQVGKIALANVIVTHPDEDHYGGLLDLFSGKLYDGRQFVVDVGNFYHSGLARYKAKPKLGNTSKGRVEPFPQGYHDIRQDGTFITDLLDKKNSFQSPAREFDESFAEYAALAGQVPSSVSRLSHKDNYLPGYAPGQNGMVIRVLGPVLEKFDAGQVGLRMFDSESVTVNGHSVVLRLDYAAARILLTGDINKKAHNLLLSYHAPEEFAADVAKACHHGSEDVDPDFLRIEKARASVVSSGDLENYSHPRPALLGAAGRYGRESFTSDGDVMAPLIYSTELARSVKLGYAASVKVNLDAGGSNTKIIVKPVDTDIRIENSVQGYRPLEELPLSADLVYGLVNVRTDGRHILCATMKENGNDFDVKVFQAGVDV